MNIYKLHTDPEQLTGYEQRLQVPKFAYEEVRDELTKHRSADDVRKATEHLQDVLLKDPKYAYLYAKVVMEDRWPAAEDIIKTVPHWAYLYTRFLLRGDRWPEAEKTILTDPTAAGEYADYVLYDRWPEAESIIATDAEASASYAENVLDGRFKMGEHTIMKEPDIARSYARNIIGGRWPEAEIWIKEDDFEWMRYKHDLGFGG